MVKIVAAVFVAALGLGAGTALRLGEEKAVAFKAPVAPTVQDAWALEERAADLELAADQLLRNASIKNNAAAQAQAAALWANATKLDMAAREIFLQLGNSSCDIQSLISDHEGDKLCAVRAATSSCALASPSALAALALRFLPTRWVGCDINLTTCSRCVFCFLSAVPQLGVQRAAVGCAAIQRTASASAGSPSRA